MKPITQHGCLAFVILLSVAFFWLEPAAAEILFKADFETGDFSQFSGKSKNIKPGHIEVVTDIVHSGKYAGRFTIHEDNVFNARQLRVQANGPKVTVKEGSDTFVSFYMYMKDAPKDRDNFFYWEGSPPPRYNNVMTWWVEPKKDGAGTFIKYGTGNLGRKGVHWEGDFTIGQWHQLGMHIHWSEDPAKGNVKLWWDGVVVLDKKVQTKGPQSVYFSQPGIHRDPHTKSVDTIYFDDFLCATTLEEIKIQKPNTAAPAKPQPPRHLRLETINGITVVSFVDPRSFTANTPEVSGQLYGLVEGHKHLLLNFDNVQYLSSDALTALVHLRKKVVAASGKIKLYCIGPDLREVFRLTRVDTLFDIYADKQGALDKF